MLILGNKIDIPQVRRLLPHPPHPAWAFPASEESALNSGAHLNMEHLF